MEGPGIHSNTFWVLGNSMREGTEWPLCSELDIHEQVNRDMEAHGALHCGESLAGVCNEPTGIAKTTSIPDNEFHTWSIAVERTSNNWQTETITWLSDGNPCHVLTGLSSGTRVSGPLSPAHPCTSSST